MTERNNVSPFRAGILFSLIGATFFAVGCASLIGIEERKDATEPEDVRPIDVETELRTSDLCIEYCDEVLGNCTGDNAVYSGRTNCINTCNALPAGEAAEPFGNNVECRLVRAKGASSTPGEECVAAGPGGDGVCGSNCDSWCHLLETECPDDFAVLADCERSCSTIPDNGGFDVEASYARDDIQCRLIHLGAVQGDPESRHCGHGRYIASEQCVPPPDGEPTCDEYCTVAMANCHGADAIYDSPGDCMAACAAFPVGEYADIDGNTVGCRLYHGKSSGQNPATHCDHASPAGDGQCGSDPSTNPFTGNCESYCFLLQEGCTDDFDAEFSDLDECATACSTDFSGSGAQDNALYTVETATNSDSLQCRIFYSVKAVVGDDTACSKAVPSSTCD